MLGTGTLADPYLVATAEDLNNVRYNLSAHYKQVDNINLCKYDNWMPIGAEYDEYTDTWYNEFIGSYDGGNFNISNLKINRVTLADTGWVQGLFGYVNTPYFLKNINIINANIHCVSESGILAGNCYNKGIIDNCHVSGEIHCYQQGTIGGLIGEYISYNGILSNCSSYVEIIFNHSLQDYAHEAGGLLGRMQSNMSGQSTIAKVLNCYASVNLSVEGIFSELTNVAGLIGYCDASSKYDSVKIQIENCFCVGDIGLSINKYSGGFIGTIRGRVDIINCYNACNISGNEAIGGFIGNIYSNQSDASVNISKCFNIGITDGNGFVGNVVTGSTFSIIDCYYNSNNPTDLYATPKTTAELKQQATYTNYNFTTIWGIDGIFNDGYPFLRNTDILIYTPQQLNNVRNYLSCSYRQMADIDLSGYANWEPIGVYYTTPFVGSYNGGNFKITNLSIVPTGDGNWGLFGFIRTTGIMQNIKIEDAVIDITDDTHDSYVYFIGSLIGCSYDGEIINCHTDVIVNITCNDYTKKASEIGGLIGEFEPDNEFSCVKNCTAHTVINNYGNLHNTNCGALIGNAWGTGGWYDSIPNLIQDCHATGIMSGDMYMGGLIGRGRGVFLERCSAITEILCNDGYSSGIAGELDDFTAKDCYAICKITCNNDPDGIGGFCANAFGDNAYENCYSVLEFINNSGIDPYLSGAFIGDYSDEPTSMINCYYDSTVTTLTDTYATPKTTTEMKTQSTFVDWDFTTPIWAIDGSTNDGYPFFYEVICGGELNVYVITNEGVKQAVKMCIITDEGLKEVKKLNVITDTGLK